MLFRSRVTFLSLAVIGLVLTRLLFQPEFFLTLLILLLVGDFCFFRVLDILNFQRNDLLAVVDRMAGSSQEETAT